jgi:hypothetical protein
VGGEQAIVEDVGYVGLSGQTIQGGGVVRGCRVCRCLDSGDAEVFAALNEAGACGSGMGFCIPGNRGVAIDDEITVRDYSGGVQLGVERAEGSERQGCDGEEKADVGERESADVGHCCTSVLS